MKELKSTERPDSVTATSSDDNWVGITSAGAAAGNSDEGMLITEDADNNRDSYNNMVGASGGHGIHIRNNSDDNWVWGNTIGLGTTA